MLDVRLALGHGSAARFAAVRSPYLTRPERDRLVALAGEAIRSRRALRTRPDYNFRCDECGAPHNLDTSIPSDMWNQIMPNGGALCTLCIDDKLAAAGLAAPAEFYFVGAALTCRLYTDDNAALRQRLADAEARVQRMGEALSWYQEKADALVRYGATGKARAIEAVIV